uniref:Tail length tape measure protein n=2 Tax=unclassified bacterial viruses TaxID=12333 RepID=A0AAU8EFI9_9VIRU
MTDRLIRELLVDIKQRGGSKAAKQIRDVEAALESATQSSEGLNQSLGKLPATFTTVERSVSRTQKSLEKLASTTSLTTLASSIGMLGTKFTEFEVGLAKSVLRITSQLNNISTSANKMGVDITAAMTSSSPHLDKVNKILAELSANANQAASALSKIKAGTNLANTSTSVNKLGASMTKLKADLEASVSGIEANLGQLSRAFASMSSVGGLNPLGNSVKGVIPQLNLLVKAANQVNSALAKIQAGRGVLQLPNQFKAITQSLNALETKLASTSQILERGFSKGFQDMATKSASSSTRMINNFQKVVPELNAIEAAAIRSAAAIDKLIAKRIRLGQAGGGGGGAAGFNMGTMVAEMNRIVAAIDAMGNKMNTTMSDMARSTDKVSDKLTDLNAGVRDVNTGLGGLNSTLTGTGSAAGRASRALGNTSGSARGATRNFAALAMVTGPMPLLYGALASNIYVLKAAFDQLKMGDQLNRLEQFGSIVGAKTGTPIQSLAIALQEATGYAVSFEEAMRQASTAAAYGFDSKQIGEFALVARRAAATLGVDMTDALNRVIKGVSKQEIELLDELGVTIRLNDAFAEHVKQLNAANTGMTYNIQSLSSFQKQQAYANAVVAESTKRFGYLDDALRATPWEQFAANADSALRKVQQAAAKYLGPVIASINAAFYSSKASISAAAAEAQQESIGKMDVKDNNAVVMNLEASQKGLDDAIKAKEEASKRLAALNKDILERESKMDMATKIAVSANYQGLGNSFTLGASEANKRFTQETADMRREAYKLQQELEDSSGAIQKWRDARDTALAKTQKGNPNLANQLNIAQNVEASDGIYTFNKDALGGAVAINKEYNNIKKTAGDLGNDIQNFAQDSNTAAKATAALGDALKAVEALAGGSTEKANQLTKDLNLGYSSVTEMNTAYKAMTNYQKIAGDEAKSKLEVEKRIADVYASTRNKDKAEEAGRALELQQLQSKKAALQAVLATNKDNKALQKELTILETEEFKIKNQGMESTKKEKFYKDKIVGIDREIALLSNRTMTDSQYNVASLKLNLQVEKDRLALLKTQADKEKEAEQSRRNIASIEREIWKEQLDRNAKTAEMRKEEFERNQSMKPLMGESQKMQEQLAFYQEMKEFTKGNADEQARWSREIANTVAQMAALKAQRNAQMMDRVGQSLGADYTPTTGLEGEDKKFADMENQMASYDTAISKLSQLNSEATATAQSMGNLANAMIQFSQGSLDTTSMIAAGMQTVSQMISYGTNQQISAIDAAIAAEQKRDGKSEQSKNKIKKMEAEKIKLQQESAKKQIIIQTAVAVMQAATAVPYPFSIPLMIAAGLAGALSLAQASSATGMTDIAGSGGETASYLTLGERQKNVDVSMGANAGELSYVRGDKGIGSANGFIPRAEGGNTYPGVSYKMGEHGTEVATPMVPTKVTPADKVASETSSGGTRRPVNLNIQAMDAKSFMEYALENPEAFQAAVELALNEQGLSLKNLN